MYYTCPGKVCCTLHASRNIRYNTGRTLVLYTFPMIPAGLHLQQNYNQAIIRCKIVIEHRQHTYVR